MQLEILAIIFICGLVNARFSVEDAKYLGEFSFVTHQVQGHLYASNSELFIHRFYYDGEGPPGVFFLLLPKGKNLREEKDGIQLEPKEKNLSILNGPVFNENVTLSIPDNLTLDQVGRIVVWCPEYKVSFGRVDLSEKPGQRPKQLIEVGNFIQTEHDISGTVFIQDANHLVIRDFNYDGQGPSVVFYAGEESNLESGKIIQYPYKAFIGILGPSKLTKIKKRDLVLKLPKQLDAFELKWLSVWCDLFEVSFGHVNF